MHHIRIIGVVIFACLTVQGMEPPVTPAPSVPSPLRATFGVSDRQGPYRESMEDWYAAILDVGRDPTHSFFALYDGHKDEKVARAAAMYLHQHYESYSRNGFSVEGALENAVLTFDALLRQAPWISGTTFLAAVLRRNKVYLGWSGDSRGILIPKKDEPDIFQATKDHTLENPDERSRVLSHGIFAIQKDEDGFERVYGDMIPTRVLGDHPTKRRGGALIPQPEVMGPFPVSAGAMIILATDGLWDVLGDQSGMKWVIAKAREVMNAAPEQVKIFKEQYAAEPPPVHDEDADTDKGWRKENWEENGNNDLACLAARCIRDEAIKQGSGDNVSVMVIIIE